MLIELLRNIERLVSYLKLSGLHFVARRRGLVRATWLRKNQPVLRYTLDIMVPQQSRDPQ